MRILTWNINGIDERRTEGRMEKLCLEILIGGDLRAAMEGAPMPPIPEVIGFQEITRRAHEAMAPHFAAAGFKLWPPKPIDREDFSAIAIRPPWTIVDVEWRGFEESPLRRGCVIATLARVDDPELKIRFMTGHMESLRSGRETRIAQAREIDSWIHEVPIPSLFAGDTNLRKNEWDEVKDDFRSKDAWILRGSPRNCESTWWPGEHARGYRFDRFWLSEHWKLKQFRTRNGKRMSDHAGVETLLEL